MNRSSRNPDAIDEIREDTSVLGRTCGYCNFTGDMMSYAQHVCPRDVMQSEIDSLRAQLAAVTERERAATANKKQLARLALWFGVCISDDGGTLWCRSCGARLDEDDDNFTTGHYTPCTLNDAAAAALAAAQPASDGGEGE